MANEKRLIYSNELSGIAFQIKQYGKGVRCVVDLNDVDNIPTADAVEVVHGKWVYDHWCEFRCSVCGEYSNSKPYKGRENYCPNCGAKMDGERKDNGSTQV